MTEEQRGKQNNVHINGKEASHQQAPVVVNGNTTSERLQPIGASAEKEEEEQSTPPGQ